MPTSQHPSRHKKGAARTAPSEGYASNQEVLGRQHIRPLKCGVVGAVHKLPKKRTVLRAVLLDALPVFLLVCPRWVSSATGVKDWVDPAHLTCDFHLSFLSTKKGRSHPAPVRRIQGTGPCKSTIPYDASLRSSEKYLDHCHRQSKSVLSDQGSAEAPHSGSVRFHPIDLRLRQIVSASSCGTCLRSFSRSGYPLGIAIPRSMNTFGSRTHALSSR